MSCQTDEENCSKIIKSNLTGCIKGLPGPPGEPAINPTLMVFQSGFVPGNLQTMINFGAIYIVGLCSGNTSNTLSGSNVDLSITVLRHSVLLTKSITMTAIACYSTLAVTSVNLQAGENITLTYRVYKTIAPDTTTYYPTSITAQTIINGPLNIIVSQRISFKVTNVDLSESFNKGESIIMVCIATTNGPTPVGVLLSSVSVVYE